ncbi:hypothetical protein CPB86DRAFT_823601 [Serendipita vermifera]|nr:hypothetical protein CPB86DRAFT_823601 [Serendipita vermifera]
MTNSTIEYKSYDRDEYEERGEGRLEKGGWKREAGKGRGSGEQEKMKFLLPVTAQGLARASPLPCQGMLLRARQIPSAINPALAIGPVPWQIRVPWQASASPGLLSDFTDVGWRSIAIGHFDESGNRQGHGTVDFIDYEGIDCSLQQFQDDFSGAFFGPYDLGSALKSGLRGNDLIPALLSDFNVWQACPPDRWIKANPSSSSLTSARAPFQTAIAGHWDKLPSEIVLEILSDLTLSELLSFTSVCRCFHHRFGDSDFLSLWLRSQLHRPLNSTHWFMPVATVNGEVDKFYAACNESKSPGASATISKSAENSVVFSAGFPLFEFFRTNFGTDSMKNRRYRTGEDLKKPSPSRSLENSDDEEEEEGSDEGDSDSSEGGGSS